MAFAETNPSALGVAGNRLAPTKRRVASISKGPAIARQNRTLLVGLGLAGLLGAALIAPGRARQSAEQPGYEVIDRLADGIVVRRYGPRLAFETAMGGVMDAPFRRLAAYIFGENHGADGAPRKIAMTVPVEVGPIGIGASQAMRFFAPERFTRETLPKPIDGSVRVVEVPGETLAVKRFAGSGAGEAASHRRAELLDALNGSAWVADGDPAFFFYDAPWVPTPLRRSEVVVRVRRAEGR